MSGPSPSRRRRRRRAAPRPRPRPRRPRRRRVGEPYEPQVRLRDHDLVERRHPGKSAGDEGHRELFGLPVVGRAQGVAKGTRRTRSGRRRPGQRHHEDGRARDRHHRRNVGQRPHSPHDRCRRWEDRAQLRRIAVELALPGCVREHLDPGEWTTLGDRGEHARACRSHGDEEGGEQRGGEHHRRDRQDRRASVADAAKGDGRGVTPAHVSASEP